MPKTNEDAVAAILFAARRYVHGSRREGIPQVTLKHLYDQLVRAVDAEEMTR